MVKKYIDVSKYQGDIDWEKVKNSGVDTVIIRAGMGKNVEPHFVKNAEKIIAAGLNLSVYWFSYAMSITDATIEARTCVDAISKYGIIPVWFDFEYNSESYAESRGINFNIDTRTDIFCAFIAEMKLEGYTAGIYINPDYIKYRLDMKRLQGVPVWLALHISSSPINFNDVDPLTEKPLKYAYNIWQFGAGTVDGIATNVDLDYCYSADSVRKPYHVGDKYTIKSTDIYTTGNRVPVRLAGKTYTIMQVRDNRILLSDIISWIQI